MIEFILNNSSIQTDLSPGMSLLDFIRGEMGLTGTKTGCREGDCGACTVMLGELVGDKVHYKTIVSCLTPLANVQAMHVVTIEGLNGDQLSLVQQALVDHSGTQCGFCTPGFVMSLMTHSLSDDTADFKKTIASIDGNICRCTGYKSIERAAKEIWELNQSRNNQDAVSWMVKNKHLPDYFSSIPQRLSKITLPDKKAHSEGVLLSGGTDLMVQKADDLFIADLNIHLVGGGSNGMIVEDGYCTIDARITAAEIVQSAELQKIIPGIAKYLRLVSSTQIRNMGTLGGNIVNASPIGDLTVLFMALDAGLLIVNSEGAKRELALSDFFTGYKQFDLNETELISRLRFRIPGENSSFNFEKVSKRKHLDIASVNTAILV
ncbi:MAG: FAD binding domain-containing protein, partial [Bacteroidales bacterium]|nr:FAD binding domain-containing protein [Bacteroidales bacterium]